MTACVSFSSVSIAIAAIATAVTDVATKPAKSNAGPPIAAISKAKKVGSTTATTNANIAAASKSNRVPGGCLHRWVRMWPKLAASMAA